MVIFLWDELHTMITIPNLRTALRAKDWSKKTAYAKGRFAKIISTQFIRVPIISPIYIDEYGCDKKVGFSRTGRSPLGVAPLQISQFHRDQRYQILPAYTQDSVCFPQGNRCRHIRTLFN
jgi:hypothetical protein